ncbi:Glutaminyl-peptide cyclotransferase [Acipenser ruthenus]|uniref:glutaminyl-peptide cyclotransferase n=1 Tax=Acipenser ruthenus TaxID=7906 RepID=A0A444U9K6_ACIRT|nr:Glutaminyl-peptide cyclotransferase [Acipenser ruthenus]
MSKGGRRFRAAAPVSPGSLTGRCDPVGRPRARVLLCGLCVVLAVAGMLGVYLSIDTLDSVRPHPADWTRDKLSHLPSRVSASQVRRLVSRVDLSRLWETHLRPLLVERLPGSPGSSAVRQHLLSSLRSLSAGWTVEVDSFSSLTPRGRVSFSNVLAVLDPEAPRRLLLACHYDSKKLPGGPFLGAKGCVDSPVGVLRWGGGLRGVDCH